MPDICRPGPAAGFLLPGATSATLTFPSVSRSDADTYDVRVNDGLSAAYSDRVRLDVLPSATPPALAYTVQVSGPGTTTGEALVEIYELP